MNRQTNNDLLSNHPNKNNNNNNNSKYNNFSNNNNNNNPTDDYIDDDYIDDDIGQALDQSRFMLEQLNLSDSPTSQQILQKAEQLQIDDLQLAKQSLTKQLPPQWKPYCNRYHEIYYINLIERLAYVDHPIDMYYKMLYYQTNSNSISSKSGKRLKSGKKLEKPEFRTWSIEEVCGSLDLVEEQISNFRTGNRKSTLRIVYQQPSQQQSQSVINPKSPINPSIISNNSNTFNPKQSPSQHQQPQKQQQELNQQQQQQNQQLSTQQLQLLYIYEQSLNAQYQTQHQNYKNQLKQNQNQLLKQSQSTIKSIIQFRIHNQLYEKYQEDLRNKNSIDFKKQQERLEREYRTKEEEYEENIRVFGGLLGKFRELERNVEDLERRKEIAGKVMAMQGLKLKIDMQKQRMLLRVKDNLVKQFNQNLSMLTGHSAEHQRTLKHELSKLYQEGINPTPSTLNKNNLKKRRIFAQSNTQSSNNNNINNNNMNINDNLIPFNQQLSQRINNNITVPLNDPDFSYEQLKKQIKQLNLWNESEQNYSFRNSYQDIKNINNKHGLNLRLRMKII